MSLPLTIPLAIVVKAWPRLSETFIAQEILGLERRGLHFILVSLRQDPERLLHPIHREITAPVLYLPEYLHRQPIRVWRGICAAYHLAGWTEALRIWFKDLLRDLSLSRIRRFGQACVLATELPDTVRHLHVHFLHSPASVTRYAAVLRGITWSFSAHAKDIWTTRRWEKRRKLSDAVWGVTCTQQGLNHLHILTSTPQTITLLYHGLDPTRFPSVCRRSGIEGHDQRPFRILTVCRAVEKKGLDIILHALALLPKDIVWKWHHIGSGICLKRLKKQAKCLGLSKHISWFGHQTHEVVIQAYLWADVFVLASRPASNRDQDGLPNVLMEAQILGLPCIATRFAGIPELIVDTVTGILVPPNDVRSLAQAIKELSYAPQRRADLGYAGYLRVRDTFNCHQNLDTLAEKMKKYI